MNSEQKDFVIGILGGMGTYATIYLFQEYVELFPAEKEWDRPRIVIDNRCTMPSVYEQSCTTRRRRPS